MRGLDIQDALLSVKEVAAFAWSLLELLLTRILPLAGFLAGHLLLHFARLLASVVISAAGRRAARAEYSRDQEAEAEGIVELWSDGRDVDADYQNEYSESLKRTRDELEEGDWILRGDQSLTHAVEDAYAGAAEELAYQDEDMADTATPDLLAPANQAQVHGIDHDVAQSPLFDHDVQRISYIVSSDTAPANEVQARGNDQRRVPEADKPVVVDVAGVEQGNVSSREGGSGGEMDLQPSDVQTREEASRSEEATSTARAMSRGEGEMRKSGRRRTRVLPPSLSHIRRTLVMERSTRRASPSPQTSPDAMQEPSPSVRITRKTKMKKHRGSRKRTSPPSFKPSSSYDDFMRKFRKHFLLDTT